MKRGLLMMLTMLLSLSGCADAVPRENDLPSAVSSTEIEDILPSNEAETLTTNPEPIRIRLTFEQGEAIVLLDDHAAARSLAEQLPLTLTFEDFNQIEKICRLPQELAIEGIPSGVDPDIADLTLYVPWNTLVFYYADYGYNRDLIPMGHVESGMDQLAAMGDQFEVTMERIEETSPSQSFSSVTTVIQMTTGDTVITAELDNSETSQAFLATLPRSLTMNAYGGREYYGRIEALTEQGEVLSDFENGDVTYYPAGPSLAVFYAEAGNSHQSGLIRMGRITSDLSALEALSGTVDIWIEIVQ